MMVIMSVSDDGYYECTFFSFERHLMKVIPETRHVH